MKSKTFKIGEEATGGIIKLKIERKLLTVLALDWDTKEVIVQRHTDLSGEYYMNVHDILEDVSTYYWADQMMKWIEKNIS